jgi:hypothetical protein
LKKISALRFLATPAKLKQLCIKSTTCENWNHFTLHTCSIDESIYLCMYIHAPLTKAFTCICNVWRQKTGIHVFETRRANSLKKSIILRLLINNEMNSNRLCTENWNKDILIKCRKIYFVTLKFFIL